MPSSYTYTDYKVGIICALPLERAAMESMFDRRHAPLRPIPHDDNIYCYGSIGEHNVVVASLGAGNYGTTSAAFVAFDMKQSFPEIKYGLLVGIAGGIPRPEERDGDIRLGDIVVGCAQGVPSVINYAHGTQRPDRFEIQSQLKEPPEALQRAVSALANHHQHQGPTYLMHLAHMLSNTPRLNHPRLPKDYYNMPDARDRLTRIDSARRTEYEVNRRPRHLQAPPRGLAPQKFVRLSTDGYVDYPKVFFGSIGSANTLMKSAARRDEVFNMVKTQRHAKLLCFEMEASGVVGDWPCLVIRGICDYSDHCKNDDWQNFAAATAAAYAKDLLYCIPAVAIKESKPVSVKVVADGLRSWMRRLFGSN